MAMSTHPVVSSTYSTFSQVVPPSRVRNTPRSAPGPHSGPIAATNTVAGSAGWMRISAMRSLPFSPRLTHLSPPLTVR